MSQQAQTLMADYLWNAWFPQLTNFKQVDSLARREKSLNTSYQGIGKVGKVWLFSMLTDIYGDIPYSHALEGDQQNVIPVFDRQKDIYLDMFKQLEEANTLLAPGTAIVATSDPVYKGDIAKWRKFANSLYLRLLLRVSNRTDGIAPGGLSPQAKLRDLVNTSASSYPLMASNDDSAILRWTGTAPYQSPFQTWRTADFVSFNSMSEFFVNNLTEWGDPRLPKWATLSNGTYEGIPSGYLPGQIPAAKSFCGVFESSFRKLED